MNSLNQQIKLLFNEQVSNWELARVNFNGLQMYKPKHSILVILKYVYSLTRRA